MDASASGAMACGFCGSRLISKAARGLECCGCGRPLLQSRVEASPRLSLRQRLLAGLVCAGSLPLVGAIVATDQLRGAGEAGGGAALAVGHAAAAPEPPQLLQLQVKEQQQAEAHADQQIVATERRGAEEAR